ncbi:ubiquitin carrier protein 7 [Zea mays]|jgi:hypothetical protein|uniref:Ubiquitin carrier protein 7 n=1 Tax=Zea mays TaxID=4577 RepID=A0A1D6K792_MAIZE|nr:ubiquitin carrier protein 7 [Zea mays]ONL99409.1 ubiquitin carrier protein 7 [Zea mays]
MRVLAVDDDPTCLKVLENLLFRCQYHGTSLYAWLPTLLIGLYIHPAVLFHLYCPRFGSSVWFYLVSVVRVPTIKKSTEIFGLLFLHFFHHINSNPDSMRHPHFILLLFSP